MDVDLPKPTILLEWRELPGTILGFFAARRTVRVMIDHHVEHLTDSPNETESA